MGAALSETVLRRRTSAWVVTALLAGSLGAGCASGDKRGEDGEKKPGGSVVSLDSFRKKN
jgi:hypothetical protein